jgi:V/A-type H+/Na+-transporting ATPase subunit K
VNDLLIIIGWLGLYAPVALGAVGSAIGCTAAGQAAIGAMLETEGGHGRYVGVAALPSSMVIYGIVVMFTLNRPVTVGTAGGLFGLGYQRV